MNKLKTDKTIEFLRMFLFGFYLTATIYVIMDLNELF